MDGMRVFVTVGTTQFDGLVQAVTSTEFLEGCLPPQSEVVVQYGRGPVPSFGNSKQDVKVRAFDFSNSLQDEMEHANLIISHAGAGSIMEALGPSSSSSTKNQKQPLKTVVVVIHAALMDNHQLELANALERRGHIFVVHDPILLQQPETFRQIQQFCPIPFSGGDGGLDFATLVHDELGLSPE
eukprot:scaffold19142_cov31-Attheya_sp.AAC.1